MNKIIIYVITVLFSLIGTVMPYSIDNYLEDNNVSTHLETDVVNIDFIVDVQNLVCGESLLGVGGESCDSTLPGVPCCASGWSNTIGEDGWSCTDNGSNRCFSCCDCEKEEEEED